MGCVGERMRDAVRMYCEGSVDEAERVLVEIFNEDVEVVRLFLEKMGIFFMSKVEKRFEPVDQHRGLFFIKDGHDMSVRISVPNGNAITITFTVGGWR